MSYWSCKRPGPQEVQAPYANALNARRIWIWRYKLKPTSNTQVDGLGWVEGEELERLTKQMNQQVAKTREILESRTSLTSSSAVNRVPVWFKFEFLSREQETQRSGSYTTQPLIWDGARWWGASRWSWRHQGRSKSEVNFLPQIFFPTWFGPNSKAQNSWSRFWDKFEKRKNLCGKFR